MREIGIYFIEGTFRSGVISVVIRVVPTPNGFSSNPLSLITITSLPPLSASSPNNCDLYLTVQNHRRFSSASGTGCCLDVEGSVNLASLPAPFGRPLSPPSTTTSSHWCFRHLTIACCFFLVRLAHRFPSLFLVGARLCRSPFCPRRLWTCASFPSPYPILSLPQRCHAGPPSPCL